MGLWLTFVTLLCTFSTVTSLQSIELFNCTIPCDQITQAIPFDRIVGLNMPLTLSVEEYERRLNDVNKNPLGLGTLASSVRIGNHSKFYPIDLFYVHEVINDELAGRRCTSSFLYRYSDLLTSAPVCMALNPLTMVGRVVEVAPNDRFANRPSGMVWLSEPLVYNQNSKSLWSPMLHFAITGLDASKAISPAKDIYVFQNVPWRVWKEAYPNTVIGYQRHQLQYGNITYDTYAQSDVILFPTHFNSIIPPYSLHFAKSQTLVVNVTGDIRLFPFDELHKMAGMPVAVTMGGKRVVIFFDPFTKIASAFYDEQHSQWAFKENIGQMPVFNNAHDGCFNIFGDPCSGSTERIRLEPAPSFIAYYFAAALFFGNRPILSVQSSGEPCWLVFNETRAAEKIIGEDYNLPELNCLIKHIGQEHTTTKTVGKVLAGIGTLGCLVVIAIVCAGQLRSFISRKNSALEDQVELIKISSAENEPDDDGSVRSSTPPFINTTLKLAN